MTTQEFFSAIAALSGLTFVVAGMLGTGASRPWPRSSNRSTGAW